MNDPHLEDETTSFTDGPVDGFVYVQSGDSPELRVRNEYVELSPRLSIAEQAPRQWARHPVEPWTPGASEEANTKTTPSTKRLSLKTPARVAAGIALASVPVLVTLWIVRTGFSLYGG